MPSVPDDLIRITDVLAQYRPKRSWWDLQVSKGKITPYRVPGDRALYLSKADVDRLTAPHVYVRGEGEDEETESDAG